MAFKNNLKLQTQKRSWVLAFALAVLIHITWIILIHYFSKKLDANTLVNTKKTPTKVRFVSKDELKKYKQIVKSDSALNSSKPKKADFLAYQNQSTPTPSLKQSTQVRKSFASNGESTISKKSPKHSLAKAKNSVSLLPTQSEIQKGLAKYATNKAIEQQSEYLPDIPFDTKSRLNTWEFKHSAFFLRVRDAIARYWDPRAAIQRNDPLRKLPTNDQKTVLEISLDPQGKVKDIEIIEKSIAAYIDQEAVLAVQKATPFSQPPQELFDGKNQFKFRMGFYIHFQKLSFDFAW